MGPARTEEVGSMFVTKVLAAVAASVLAALVNSPPAAEPSRFECEHECTPVVHETFTSNDWISLIEEETPGTSTLDCENDCTPCSAEVTVGYVGTGTATWTGQSTGGFRTTKTHAWALLQTDCGESETDWSSLSGSDGSSSYTAALECECPWRRRTQADTHGSPALNVNRCAELAPTV